MSGFAGDGKHYCDGRLKICGLENKEENFNSILKNFSHAFNRLSLTLGEIN
jgi:hypothetical protein